MSLAELQAYYTSPRLTVRPYARNLKKSRLKINRLVKLKIRRTRSKVLAYSRKQYYLSTAYKDLKVSSSQNEDIFIMAVTSIVVMSLAAAVTAAEIFLNFFLTAFILSESASMNLLFVVGGAATALLVIYAWFTAFLFNLLSISIMDGATKKVIRSVRLTFRKSLAMASRVASAWLLLLCLIGLPLIIAAVIGYISLQFMNISVGQLLSIAQFGVIGGIIWVLYSLLSYSLIPCVALFEETQTLMGTITRSKQLLQRKGRIFILATYLLFSAVLTGEYVIAAILENLISLEKWLSFTFLALPTLLLLNGIMVIFYRKRRLARKY